MEISKFARESGFKLLAVAKLSSVEYSIVLYLINCAASGLSEVITTESELSSLIGYDEKEVRRAIGELENRKIIRSRYGAPHKNPDIDSLRIGMQFDIKRWQIDIDSDLSSRDAVVFPFRRQGPANLHLLTDQEVEEKATSNVAPAWKRVFDAFIQNRSLDDDELKQVEEYSKVLVDTHPVDQVLLLVRFFGHRIPTLSLLASSWQHYHEMFVNETQKVDLIDARQKHYELDEQLRSRARSFLSQENDKKLSDEERTVLDIIIRHRHPRRQLFWAYQTRDRYPNLKDFFADTDSLMLPVTNTGRLIHRHNPHEE